MKALVSREGTGAMCTSRDAISINHMHAFRDEIITVIIK